MIETKEFIMYDMGLHFGMILNINEPCRTFKKNKNTCFYLISFYNSGIFYFYYYAYLTLILPQEFSIKLEKVEKIFWNSVNKYQTRDL